MNNCMFHAHTQGKNEECATGQWCFIDIDCSVIAILKPSATSNLKKKKQNTGEGDGKRKKKKNEQQQQLQQLSGDKNDSGSGGDGRSGGASNSNVGVDKHIIGKSRRNKKQG